MMVKFIGLSIALIFAGFLDDPEVFAANASDVLINEVYYDVDSSHGAETANEWLEIYNNTDSSLDIAGWTLTDNNSTKTIPTTIAQLAPRAVAVISPDTSTWNYW